MEKIKVKDLCQPCSSALFVKEDDGIEAAIRRFTSKPDVHALYVVDKKQKLKGLVKIRHLLNWVRLKLGVHQERRNITIAEAFDVIKLSQSSRIGDVISPSISVRPNDTLGHAVNLMANEELVELAVADDKNRLIGEVKLTTVMAYILDSFEKEKKK